MNPDFGLLTTRLSLEFLHLPKSQFFWGKGSVLPSIVFMGNSGGPVLPRSFSWPAFRRFRRSDDEALEIDGGNSWR